MDRRALLAASAALASGAWAEPDRFGDVERSTGGRLGVAALDTGTGRRWAHRADERFPMASTFKWLAVSQVLSRVDRGREQLSRRIPYTKADLLEYAPVTAARVGEGAMSLNDLCEAAITMSDNTAANLILTTLGGPAGLTRWIRGLGDPTTRLDRNEPTLNEAEPGDPRDTTTPSAMLADLRRVLTGPVLQLPSRRRLLDWLAANKTGDDALRRGVPMGWRVGDKTGSGMHGSRNDVGILWPPAGKPILVAAYIAGATASGDVRNVALAGIAKILTYGR